MNNRYAETVKTNKMIQSVSYERIVKKITSTAILSLIALIMAIALYLIGLDFETKMELTFNLKWLVYLYILPLVFFILTMISFFKLTHQAKILKKELLNNKVVIIEDKKPKK